MKRSEKPRRYLYGKNTQQHRRRKPLHVTHMELCHRQVFPPSQSQRYSLPPAALSATLFNNLNKFLDYPSLSPFSILQRATVAAPSILPPHLDEAGTEGGGVNCADKIEISAPAAICQMSAFSPRQAAPRSGSWITRRRREGGGLWMMICPRHCGM